jgi:hypothetical protein
MEKAMFLLNKKGQLFCRFFMITKFRNVIPVLPLLLLGSAVFANQQVSSGIEFKDSRLPRNSDSALDESLCGLGG